MDYFIVFLLLIIIFTFMSDKKVNSIQELESKNENINNEINEVYNNILITKINKKLDNNKELKKTYKKLIAYNKQYVLIKTSGVNLNLESVKTLIANYINVERKACGFMPSYTYKYMNHKTFNDIKQELKIATINYINIFSKEDLNSYGVIILNKEELENIINDENKSEIITFSPSEQIEVTWNENNKNNVIEEVKEIYDADFKAVIKSGLLIAVGLTVTANIISATYDFNLNNIIISGIMYWCYMFVLKYMYSPIGKYKVVAKYLFPIFLMCYLVILFIGSITKKRKKNVSNKNVHVS